MALQKRKQPLDIAIIGAGTLASALATALRRSGYRINEIVSRDNAQSLSRARKLAKRVGTRAVYMREARLAARVIWICVPDDAIPGLAIQLARRRDWQQKLAIHSSGALGSDVLAPLKKAGAFTASAHPLMTFVSISKPELDKVPFALEGHAKALATISAIVRRIGGKPFPIAPEMKPAYHLFGFFSSPALVALLTAAQQVGELAGFARRHRSPELMEPIVRQTIDNFFRSTPQQAFSGPLRRGDIATLRKHLAVLSKHPELLAIYKSLALIALKELPVANAEALRNLLR